MKKNAGFSEIFVICGLGIVCLLAKKTHFLRYQPTGIFQGDRSHPPTPHPHERQKVFV